MLKSMLRIEFMTIILPYIYTELSLKVKIKTVHCGNQRRDKVKMTINEIEVKCLALYL